MPGIKADWRLAELLEINNDPFEDVILSSGLTVNLDGTDEELAEAFVALRDRERKIASEGIKCELRESGYNCADCKVAQLQRTHPMSSLCRMGKDMETVWAVHDRRETARREPIQALIELADECSEIGHVDDELLDWILGAGV
jgi:hypothetical protein